MLAGLPSSEEELIERNREGPHLNIFEASSYFPPSVQFL